MSRMRLLQDLRLMKFEDILSKRTAGKLTQEQGAEILGISVLTLRRWEGRYEAEGLKGFTIAGLVSWTNRSTRSPLRTAAMLKIFRCGPRCEGAAWCTGGPRWKISQGGSRGDLAVSMGIVCKRSAGPLFLRIGLHPDERCSQAALRVL